jgi:hypothetical protein
LNFPGASRACTCLTYAGEAAGTFSQAETATETAVRIASFDPLKAADMARTQRPRP